MRFIALALLLCSAACGGKVFVDDPSSSGQGGSGGAGSTTTTTTTTTSTTSLTTTTNTGITTTTTTSTGPGFCTDHADCPGEVCVFSTGLCARTCEPGTCDSCGPGMFCESCGTSSCPACADCVAACIKNPGFRCDDDDPCPDAGQVCVFSSGICAPRCDGDMDCGGFAFCDFCVTGSCCGCDDCVAACVGGE